MTLVLDDAQPRPDGATTWVLVDRVLVRADDVTDDGRTVQVRVRVASADVVAALEALRPGVVRRPERRVTWNGVSVAGRQTTVEVEPGPTGWRVDFSVERPTRAGWRDLPGSLITTTTGTYSHDRRAERTLRRLLFGERMPREPFGMSESLPDFTADLPPEGTPEETYAAAFRLLVTEALISSGAARRVTAAEVSPAGPGGRHVHITWLSAVHSQGHSPGHSPGPTSVEVEGLWQPGRHQPYSADN